MKDLEYWRAVKAIEQICDDNIKLVNSYTNLTTLQQQELSARSIDIKVWLGIIREKC